MEASCVSGTDAIIRFSVLRRRLEWGMAKAMEVGATPAHVSEAVLQQLLEQIEQLLRQTLAVASNEVPEVGFSFRAWWLRGATQCLEWELAPPILGFRI